MREPSIKYKISKVLDDSISSYAKYLLVDLMIFICIFIGIGIFLFFLGKIFGSNFGSLVLLFILFIVNLLFNKIKLMNKKLFKWAIFSRIKINISLVLVGLIGIGSLFISIQGQMNQNPVKTGGYQPSKIYSDANIVFTRSTFKIQSQQLVNGGEYPIDFRWAQVASKPKEDYSKIEFNILDGKTKNIRIARTSAFKAAENSAIRNIGYWRYHGDREGKIVIEINWAERRIKVDDSLLTGISPVNHIRDLIAERNSNFLAQPARLL